MTDESDRITVRRDDLLVEKGVESDPSGVGTVTLRLVSAARRPLAVRVVDDPPGDDRRELRAASGDLSVENGAVALETVLGAGEITTERYEVAQPDPAALAGSIAEPSVSVEPLEGSETRDVLYRSCAGRRTVGSGGPVLAGGDDRDADPDDGSVGPDGDATDRSAADDRAIASAVAGAVGADVYRLWLRFSPGASPDEREAVVSELESSLLAVEVVSDRSGTFEAVIATSHDPEAVVAAVEDVRFVDRASVAPDEPGETRDRPARADAVGPPDPPGRFEAVRRRTEPLDPDQLLDDPAYREFLDSFDELSGPEDEMSMRELLEYAESGEGDGSALEDESAGGGLADGDGAASDGPANGEIAADGPADGDAVATAGRTGGDGTTDGAATAGDGAWEFDAATVDAGDPLDDHDTVAEALLAELERDAVSPEQRARLREALGVDGAGSLDARVSYLQSRFHDLASYVDALESFVDEYGSGDRFLDELTAELETLREDLAAVRRAQAAHERKLEAIRRRLADVEDRDADLRALEESVETLERRHETVRDDVDVALERWERLSGLFEEE